MVESSRWPMGMQNNNPGNIKYVPSINWQGQVGPSQNTDQGDPQVLFNSQSAGMRALAKNVLYKYNNSGATTIGQLISGPGGWTPGYAPGAAGVAAAAGYDVNQPLDMSNPEVLANVMRGIVTQEQGPSSAYYTGDMIDQGVQAALGHPIPPMNVPEVGSAYADTSRPTQYWSPSLGTPKPVPLAPDMRQADQMLANSFNSLVPQAQPQGTGYTDLGTQLGFSPITAPNATPVLGGNNSGYPQADALYPGNMTAASGAIPLMGRNASGSPDDRMAASMVPTPLPFSPSMSPAYGSSALNEVQRNAMLSTPSVLSALTGSNGTSYSPPSLINGSNGGAIYTGNGMAGSAQLPSNFQPSFPGGNSPSGNNNSSWQSLMTPSAPAGSSSNTQSWQSLVPSTGGGNSGNSGQSNGQSWSNLSNSFASAPSGSSSMAMNDPGYSAPKTISQTSVNPAYTSWANLMSSPPSGSAANAQSWGDLSNSFAPAGSAANLQSWNALSNSFGPAPPQYITTQVPNPAYAMPALGYSAGFGATDPNALGTQIGNWFAGTPIGHLSSFMQGQMPLSAAQPGSFPGLLGMLTQALQGNGTSPQIQAAPAAPSAAQLYHNAAAQILKTQPNGDPFGNVGGLTTSGYNLMNFGQGGSNASNGQNSGGSLSGGDGT